MKAKLFFVFALISVLMTFSCSKQDTPDPEKPTSGQWFRNEGLTISYDSLQFSENVAILGTLKAKDAPWARARAGLKLVNHHKDAKVLILDNSSISSYEAELDSAYVSNRFVILVNPDLEKLKSLRSKYGWAIILPDKAPEHDFLFCFCYRHSYLSPAPVRIMTPIDTLSSEDHPYITEIKGEEIYENMSAFSNGHGLMQFIILAKKDLSNWTKGSSAAGGLTESNNTQFYNFDVNKYFNDSMSCRGGKTRYFRFYYSSSVKYKIFPCYVPDNAGEPQGDYYTISATASYYAPTACEYESDFKTAHGSARYWKGKGDKSYWGDCQYMGPYNKQMIVNIKAEDNNITFTPDGNPVPGTEIDTKTYTDSKEHNWSAGLSGGLSKDGFNLGFNLGFGGSKTNTVSYSVSDLKVVNNNDGKTPKYEFNYQNLPSRDDKFDNYSLPSICKSTADFALAWEWICPGKEVGDTTVIPLTTKLDLYFCWWARDKVKGSWKNDLWTYHREESQTSKSALSVVREPIGCLQINNRFTDNTLLYKVVVVEVLKDKEDTVFSETASSFHSGEYIEALLPQRGHTYKAYLKAGKSLNTAIPYHSVNNFTLEVLKSSGSKVGLNISETSSDFVSDYGKLQVKNESTTKLIMNLNVRTTDGASVYCLTNSIGTGKVAEIRLPSGKEYYVTMEYGSSSKFDLYKSAKNFTLTPYVEEADIKLLVAKDDGGDFIKM